MSCGRTCQHSPCIFPKCALEEQKPLPPNDKLLLPSEVLRQKFLENGWEP